jgi:hypothetical protein
VWAKTYGGLKVKREIRLSTDKVTLQITKAGDKVDMSVYGQVTPTLRKAIDQLRDKPIDILTALKLLYPIVCA